jgi:rod shape-determining protein MreC
VIRLLPARRAKIERITTPLLVLASALMIIVGKADQVAFQSLRSSIIDALSPALEISSRPALLLDRAIDRALGFVRVYGENKRLAEENEKLRAWQLTTLGLASENAKLRDLLNFVPEPPSSYLTARVVAASDGVFVKSLVVAAGRDHGVARGQAALVGDGLIGRVSEVGARASRILLITDLNSRVPVIVEGSGERAILVGDNSPHPSLSFADPGAAIRTGDRIVTSGQGGVFPPGLPVGVVAASDGGPPRVEPYGALSRVDYIRIVDYGLADALPDPLSLLPRGARRREASASSQILRR